MSTFVCGMHRMSMHQLILYAQVLSCAAFLLEPSARLVAALGVRWKPCQYTSTHEQAHYISWAGMVTRIKKCALAAPQKAAITLHQNMRLP
mmetsp:Transcript_25101/g.62204  ORF Transcript_25101/g.62204 Transcript_25101/m.62204 type:complete len:91 (-) Transcript_25101:433-705(-)